MENTNSSETRRQFTAEQKFKIIKEQMTTKSSVSEICKKYDIGASAFYRWQEQFLSGALDAFKQSKSGPSRAELRKIEELEKSSSRMKSVIAEIIAENIELKKNFG